jgi:hypothetical protein
MKFNAPRLIVLAALIIALPLLAGAIYDVLNPLSVSVDDHFPPTFEQFKIETFKKMSNRDIYLSGLDEDAKLREAYKIISDVHWNRVTQQTHRKLYMYGALALAPLCYLLFVWAKDLLTKKTK